MRTISGESRTSRVSRTIEVVLALYSVIVFATVAGSVAAFFLERREQGKKG